MDSPAPATADSAPKPTGVWGMLLTSLPVGLTVLATAFAGLSSSEMTQAMYYRSLAAQYQSKAGDQWAFFQAKKMRGTQLQMTTELLQSLSNPAPFDLDKTGDLCGQLAAALEKEADSKDGKNSVLKDKLKVAIATLKSVREKIVKLRDDEKFKSELSYVTAELPVVKAADTTLNEKDVSALGDARAAILQRQTETETAALVRNLDPLKIEEATRRAERTTDVFDKDCKRVGAAIEQIRAVMKELAAARNAMPPNGDAAPLIAALDAQEKGFKAATLGFDARRYGKEADLNSEVAQCYEIRVRWAGVQSDRRRERSMMFFYSMLMAQAGVTIASLALARAQRKALWLFAAFAGLVALGFSSYVYISF